MRRKIDETVISAYRRRLQHEGEEFEADRVETLETTSAKEMLVQLTKFLQDGSAATVQKIPNGFRITRAEKIQS